MLEAEELARELVSTAASKGLRIAVAESCTGGLLASLVTDVPGASDVLWGGVISYSNAAKTRLLGVTERTLADFGAVSKECAAEMAAGILAASGADIGLAITGVAGPSGGTSDKPIGTVWTAWTTAWGSVGQEVARHSGDRMAIRYRAAEQALRRIIRLATERVVPTSATKNESS